MWFLKILFGKRPASVTSDDDAQAMLIHHQAKTEDLERRVKDLEREKRLLELRKEHFDGKSG